MQHVLPSAFCVATDATASRSSDQVPAPQARSRNSGIQSPAGEAGTRTQGTLSSLTMLFVQSLCRQPPQWAGGSIWCYHSAHVYS